MKLAILEVSHGISHSQAGFKMCALARLWQDSIFTARSGSTLESRPGLVIFWAPRFILLGDGSSCLVPPVNIKIA